MIALTRKKGLCPQVWGILSMIRAISDGWGLYSEHNGQVFEKKTQVNKIIALTRERRRPSWGQQ